MSRFTATRHNGFSLAEILVLLALLAVSILGLLTAQTYALKCSNYNRARHTAATIMESEVNAARAELVRDFSSDPSHPREANAYAPDFQSELVCVYAPTSATLTYGADENLKEVRVAVYWRDAAQTRTERKIEGWTLVYRVH